MKSRTWLTLSFPVGKKVVSEVVPGVVRKILVVAVRNDATDILRGRTCNALTVGFPNAGHDLLREVARNPSMETIRHGLAELAHEPVSIK